MKRTILLSMAMLCLCCNSIIAQDDMIATETKSEVYESDVSFSAIKPTSQSLTESQKTTLKTKVEKIIGRAGAGNITECDAFGIEADIEVKDSKTTMGLVRNVSVMTADVTLTAKNILDGSVYYSKSIEVTADAVGKATQAMDALIAGIKVTDPTFVRFVKTARSRIAEWYNARSLPLPTRLEQKPDTVFINNGADNMLTTPDAAAPVQQEPYASQEASCKIKVSTENILVSFIECIGKQNNEMIKLSVNITNVNDRDNMYRGFEQAWAAGTTSEQFQKLSVAQDTRGRWEDFPRDVPTRKDFTIHNVRIQPNTLSYVKFVVGGTTVEMRDVPVTWR